MSGLCKIPIEFPEIDDVKWYRGFYHQYNSPGADTCVNFSGDANCCQLGSDVNNYLDTDSDCKRGRLICGGDVFHPNKMYDLWGPYDSEAACIADAP